MAQLISEFHENMRTLIQLFSTQKKYCALLSLYSHVGKAETQGALRIDDQRVIMQALGSVKDYVPKIKVEKKNWEMRLILVPFLNISTCITTEVK